MAPPVMPQPLPAPKSPTVRDTPIEPPPDLPAAPKPQPHHSSKPTPALMLPSHSLKPRLKIVWFCRKCVRREKQSINPRSNRTRARAAAFRALADGSRPAAPGLSGWWGRGGRGFWRGPDAHADQGVDFTSYLAARGGQREANWYSVMPESAHLGDQGRVSAVPHHAKWHRAGCRTGASGLFGQGASRSRRILFDSCVHAL